jgi:hypothetical protein
MHDRCADPHYSRTKFFSTGEEYKSFGTTGPDFVVTHRWEKGFLFLILSVCGEAASGYNGLVPACPG